MTSDHAPTATSPDLQLLATPARQSPVAFVFIAWRFVRRLGMSAVVAAFLFVVNGGLAVGAWAAGLIAGTALLVSSALSWWRFTFCVVGDELVVTKGVVSVDRLVIPLDRVQSVSIDQRLFHRPFGLVRAAVDTAGSAAVEFEIDALDRPRAEALRRIAADSRPTTTGRAADGRLPPPDPPDVVVARRTPSELVRIGFTKVPLAGLAVLAPLVAFGDEIGALAGIGERIEGVAEGLVDVGDDSVGAAIGVVAGVIMAALVVGALFQVVGELLTNWQLTVLRTPSGLRRTAGLLNTTSRSTTTRRVQIVTTDDTWPQRKLGFTRLTLRTFGGSDLDLPGATVGEVDRLRAIATGPLPPPPADRMISGWSVFVELRRRAVLAGALALVGWLAVGWWSLLTLLIVPLSAPTATARWRRRRWGLGEHNLGERYGLIWCHTGELVLHKAQVVRVSQSFFERRRGLATLEVTTAGGAIAVPFIDLADATAARDVVVHRAEADRRPVL